MAFLSFLNSTSDRKAKDKIQWNYNLHINSILTTNNNFMSEQILCLILYKAITFYWRNYMFSFPYVLNLADMFWWNTKCYLQKETFNIVIPEIFVSLSLRCCIFTNLNKHQNLYISFLLWQLQKQDEEK
jgi:hypothetical protein